MVFRTFRPLTTKEPPNEDNWERQQNLNNALITHPAINSGKRGAAGTALHEEFWEDLRFSMNAIRVTGASAPTWGTFISNIYGYGFAATGTEEAWLNVQLPHSWVEGSELRPHVHWSPTNTNTGSVVWGLDYIKATVNGVFSAQSTIYAVDPGDGVAYKHQKAIFPVIDMSNDDFSTMLLCRIFRDGDNALDTHNNKAFLHEVDFHIKKNSLGTIEEFSK